MLDVSSRGGKDGQVTDPEELRTRAASIFERLRQEGGRTAGEASAEADGERAADEDSVAADGSALGSDPGGSDQVEAAHEEAVVDAPLVVEPGEAADQAVETAPDSTAVEGETDEPAPTLKAPVRTGGSTTGLPADLPSLGDVVESTRAPGWRGERPLPRILAIANQKGGVGKTTTAVNLGAALAELGYRVLVIDLDPQGNATTGLGINARNLDTSIYDILLHDVPIEDCIEPTSLRNLFVVPATIDLAGAEIELVPVFSRELRLRRAVERIKDDFDFTLIDCPPSLGLLTVNGLAAATEVVVPIQCEYYALEGLGQLLRNVNLVAANLNPSLEVTTIILTMYDARTRLAEQVVADVRSHFGDRVCRSVVPRTVRLSEAPSFGQPIIVFDSSSRGAIAYRELAKEVSGGAPQRVG
jgi:chromosome partitioning protein